jgi:probable HAF family extracellular repeat protein
VTATHPYGINNRGDIVGHYGDQSGTHGFLYADGAFISLEVPNAGRTSAYGINERYGNDLPENG